MKVMLVDAAGNDGTRLVANALKRGHAVTAFARDQDLSTEGLLHDAPTARER